MKAEEDRDRLQVSEARLRALLRATSDVIYRMSPDWVVMHALDGRGLLVDTEAPRIRWQEEYLFEEDRPAILEVIREAIRTRSVFELEHRVRRKDGLVGWFSSRAIPIEGAHGEIVEWFGAASDITARKKADDALHESEERLRLAARAGEIGTWDLDFATGRGCFDNQALVAMGLAGVSGASLEFDLEAWPKLVHPEDRALVEQVMLRAHSDNSATHEIEFRGVAPAADGRLRWLVSHGAVLRDNQGRAARAVGVVRNITARKRADERRKLLVDELNHRVKNTLAVVQSLARQSFRSDAAREEQTLSFEERLHALAAAHNLLTEANWERAELLDVISLAIRAHPPDRFELRGGREEIPPSVAVSLTLALHELCTNAAKYGALSGDNGQVSLSWSVDRSAARILELRWRESGGPTVHAPRTAGFGSRMLARVLSAEPAGRVELKLDPAGVICEMQVGLEREAPLLSGRG